MFTYALGVRRRRISNSIGRVCWGSLCSWLLRYGWEHKRLVRIVNGHRYALLGHEGNVATHGGFVGGVGEVGFTSLTAR